MTKLARNVEVISPAAEVLSGNSVTFKAAVDPEASNKAVSWSIAEGEGGAYATINSKGVLTAKAAKDNLCHEVTVRATAKDAGGVSGTCEISVRPKVTAMQILVDDVAAKAASIDLRLDDRMLAVVAKPTPDAAPQRVSWKSSNAKVVTVLPDADDSRKCTLTGKKAGKVTITVTAADGSKKAATLTVTVGYLAQTLQITGKDDLSPAAKQR